MIYRVIVIVCLVLRIFPNAREESYLVSPYHRIVVSLIVENIEEFIFKGTRTKMFLGAILLFWPFDIKHPIRIEGNSLMAALKYSKKNINRHYASLVDFFF